MKESELFIPCETEPESFEQRRLANLRHAGLLPRHNPFAGKEFRMPNQFGKEAPPVETVVFEE